MGGDITEILSAANAQTGGLIGQPANTRRAYTSQMKARKGGISVWFRQGRKQSAACLQVEENIDICGRCLRPASLTAARF